MDAAEEAAVLAEFRERCAEIVEPLSAAAHAAAAVTVQLNTLLAAMRAPTPHPMMIAALMHMTVAQTQAVSDAMGRVGLIWLSRDGGQA